MLFGQKGTTGGGLLGGIVSGLGALFGGARANGGPVMGNRAYLVGERGPEVIVPRGAGDVISNASLRGAGGGQDRMIVDVQPSPLFATTVTLASEQGGARAASRVVKRATSRTLSSSLGA